MLVFFWFFLCYFGCVLFSKTKLFLVWVCLVTFLCFIISFLDFIIVFKRINSPVLSWDNPVCAPSTPSLSQISPTLFPLNFPTNLDARYQEQSSNNTPLRLDRNTFVAPPPLFGQHQESHRLHNWAFNRLQYRHDIHKDIQEHNIQILQQNSLTLKFEFTKKLNNIIQHPFPPSPSNITAQPLTPPFITTDIIYKYDRYT